MEITELTDFSDITDLRDVIAEYMRTLPFDISYQSPEKELEDLSAQYSYAVGGAIFIAEEQGKIAGCVAVKKIGDQICEMKRLYVRPAFRGRKLGQQLADTIVKKAAQLGNERMYLDTHREAQAVAIAMYRKMGFRECADYHANPGKLLCLELDLTEIKNNHIDT
ncbi:MAG TPA: GNAT family N-acetyltransferase [Bacteroidia bacterium]|nr:GNAT family N-acetyltransferase [Bacteroidia bacterium]